MIENTFKVFTKKLAIKLREQGFTIVETVVNSRKPQFDIYCFEDTPELRQAVERLSKSR